MAKVRALARTVDLLGRQQIATVQNAFVELFKNAYDADATQIRVDYLKNFCADHSDLISIRDDGCGMTKADFENKWFVVGTDNKLHVGGDRLQTGEKGIGRLSIALLGRIVLVLSRAAKTRRYVASLIHWGLFELAGLELGDLEFPVLEFDGENIPSRGDLVDLKNKLMDSMAGFPKQRINGQEELLRKIRQEIDTFLLDPQVVSDYLLRSLDEDVRELVNTNKGTWFLIGCPSDMFVSALEDEQRGGRESRRNSGFRSMLNAFTDTTFSGAEKKFRTSFCVWEDNAFIGEDILHEDAFLGYNDLRLKMDYFLEGAINRDGKFVGTLLENGSRGKQVEIESPLKDKCECGPFLFCFGTLQWQKEISEEAKRSSTEYDRLRSILDEIGGVYIYRNGIRILPYGSQLGGDWLEVDRHRVHMIGRYFISKRNMLGAVRLKGDDSPNLLEKAGREGFQKNKAFKQLRVITLNIITTLSARYLSIDGKSLERYRLEQEDEKARRHALKELKKQAREAQVRLRKRIMASLENIEAGVPEREVAKCVAGFKEQLKERTKDSPSGFVLGTLQFLPAEVYDGIDKIRESYDIQLPSGVPIDRQLKSLWGRYQEAFLRLDAGVFVTAKLAVSEAIESQIKPLEDLYGGKFAKAQMEGLLNAGVNHARKQNEKATRALNAFLRLCEHVIEESTSRVSELNVSARTEFEDQIVQSKGSLSARFIVDWQQRTYNDTRKLLQPCYSLEALLHKVVNLLKESETGAVVDVLAALQQSVSDYEDRAEEDYELLQKGIAVAILEHEFLSTADEVDGAVKELRSLSRLAPAVEPLADRVSNGFAHLQSFLSVLDPLQRRAHAQKIDITGAMVSTYLRRAFGTRIERDGVTFVVRESLDDFTINVEPSILYPVLVNLLDNALYWVSTNSSGERLVVLESRHGELVLSNNGPAIKEDVKEVIFTRGFSMKPGGRGLGLFIAREVLHDSGYELVLGEPASLCNAAFSIRRNNARKF